MAGIKRRNPGLVFLFGLITFGIYSIYWLVSTTNELRRNTKSAPNPWLLLVFVISVPLYAVAVFSEFLILLVIPIYLAVIVVAGYYYWRYAKAINELTGFSAAGMFALLFFVGIIGQIIAQIQLNKKAD